MLMIPFMPCIDDLVQAVDTNTGYPRKRGMDVPAAYAMTPRLAMASER